MLIGMFALMYKTAPTTKLHGIIVLVEKESEVKEVEEGVARKKG